MSLGGQYGVQCLSARVQGHRVRRGKGLEWARAVKIAMAVWVNFAGASHSCLTCPMVRISVQRFVSGSPILPSGTGPQKELSAGD